MPMRLPSPRARISTHPSRRPEPGHGVVSTAFLPVDPGQSYTKYLPSLSLNYRLHHSDQLRFAVAKVLSRPPIDLLKSGTASWVSNGQYNLYSGTNPLLDPMYATQYDLALQHYFAHSSGVIGADLFYKHIDSFVQTITDYNFDFASAGFKVPTDPSTGKLYLNGEYMTAYNNTQGGICKRVVGHDRGGNARSGHAFRCMIASRRNRWHVAATHSLP